MELSSRRKTVAIGLGYVNMLLQNGVVFFLTPLMLMAWDASSFGLYRLLLSFMTYFMLIDAGVSNTIIKFITEYRAKDNKSKERSYVGFLVSFYTLTAFLLVFITMLLSKYIPNLYSASMTEAEINIMLSVLPWITVYAIANLFFNCFTAIMRAHNKQSTVQLVSIIRAIVRFLMLWFILSNEGSIKAVIIADALLVVIITILVFSFVNFKMKVRPSIIGLNKTLLKEVFSFTSIMFVNTLAFAMFWSLDSVILSLLTTTTLVGVYAVGATITNLFQAFSSVISQVIVPDIMVMGYHSNDQKLLDDKMVQVGRLKFMWLLFPAIGFISFGREFLELWVGTGFEEVYTIVLIVVIPQIVALIQDVPSNIMYVRNKHKPMAWFSLMAAVINLVLTIVLVLEFGIIGAAVGTLVAFSLVYIVFTSYYYSKSLGFNMRRLYKEVILDKALVYILLIGIGLFIGHTQQAAWGLLIIKVAIFSVVFGIAMWLLVMNSEEKKMMLNILKIKQN